MLKSKICVPHFGLLACGALIAFVAGCPGMTGGDGNANQPAMNNGNTPPVMNNANVPPITGTAAAGMTLYTTGRSPIAACTGCHATNGVGGAVAAGADLTNNTTAATVESGMRTFSASATASHAGFIESITDQDFADLAAFFGTL